MSEAPEVSSHIVRQHSELTLVNSVGFEYREDLYNLFINRFNTNGRRNQTLYRILAFNTGIIREKIVEGEITTLLLLNDVCIYEVGINNLITRLDHLHIEVPSNLRKRNKLLNRIEGGRDEVLVNKRISFRAEVAIYTRTNGTIDFSFRKISKIKKCGR